MGISLWTRAKSIEQVNDFFKQEELEVHLVKGGYGFLEFEGPSVNNWADKSTGYSRPGELNMQEWYNLFLNLSIKNEEK